LAAVPPPAGVRAPRVWFRRGWVLRASLTLVAVAFLVLFVVVPAANVFARALSHGWRAYGGVFAPQLLEDPKRVAEIDAALRARPAPSLKERRALTKEREEILGAPARAKANWAAVRMTLGVAAVVVPLNVCFGVAAAWGVTKFRFRGRSILVSLIDLPFAVSPVVAGMVFVLLFGRRGFLETWDQPGTLPGVFALVIVPAAILGAWLLLRLTDQVARRLGGRGDDERVGRRRAYGYAALFFLLGGLSLTLWLTGWSWSWAFLRPSTWEWPVLTSLYWRGFGGGHWWPVGAGEWDAGVIFTPLAVVIASLFITFPFVARSLIPLMESQGMEAEQAAVSLGAGGWYTFRRVTLPSIKWGLLYGVILCSARAFGEFGAVSVVTGHRDSLNTMPLRIEQLDQSSRAQAAFTVASVLAMLAVVTLVIKTFVEWRTRAQADDEQAGPKTVFGGARH
jgi:sulfate transport system permease protein